MQEFDELCEVQSDKVSFANPSTHRGPFMRSARV